MNKETEKILEKLDSSSEEQSDIALVKAYIDELESTLEEKVSQMEILQEKIDELEEENNDLQTMIDELNARE